MDIVFSTATALATAIRRKEVSALEVLDAHLSQIERHNAALNAVITLEPEQARKRARKADQALARGEVWGPLHGVPYTLKDALCTAGMRTTVGFPPLADHVPQEDSTVAARLKGAGGILMGKTNVPLMLADYQTDNPLFGRTNNPWDLGRTPGGSSGGAAAALAAGLTPLEVGSDLSGSVRLPAHFCGVYGLKTTEHRIPITGVIPNPQHLPLSVRIMTTLGPMARSADDLTLLYSLLAGPDGMDTDVPPMPAVTDSSTDLKKLRVAVALTFPGLPVSADTRAAVLAFAHHLEHLGVQVDEAKLPSLNFTDDLTQAGSLIQMITSVFPEVPNATPTTLGQYFTALDRRDGSIRAWEQFFGQWDMLLCPVSAITAFEHCAPGTPLALDGHDMPYQTVSAHTTIFNYTGHPALTIPYTLDKQGLPLGVQLVGRRWDEARLLRLAAAVTADLEFRFPDL
jgi:amidase